MKKKLVFMNLFVLFFNSILMAQLEYDMICGHTGENISLKKGHGVNNTKFINPNPTGIDFKVSVLYFKAADDYFLLEVRKNNVPLEVTPDLRCGATDGLAEGLLVSYSENNSDPEIRPADNIVENVGTPSDPILDGDATDLFPNGGMTSITPYTTPNTNDHNGNNTHIAITNIHYNGDDIVFNIYQNYWSGALTSNTTWTSANSPYYIGGDITVESGVTLTISSGVQVIFLEGDDQSGGALSSKCELIVNGTLNAQGTSANPIEFTCNSGMWYGIRFINANNNSELACCEIENADKGVFISYCSPTISDCYIHDNATGIQTSSASPVLQYNTVTGNNTGMNFDYYSEPDANAAYNVITDNSSGNGMVLSTYTDADFGHYPDGGYNTIDDNSSYDIYMYNNSSLMAEYCWWGEYPPSIASYVGGDCSVDTDYPLKVDPGGGSPLAKSGVTLADSKFDPAEVYPDDPESLWQWGRYVRYHDQDPAQAMDINK